MTGRKSGAHDNNSDMGNKAQGEDYGPVIDAEKEISG
jgi:hypothetical protein